MIKLDIYCGLLGSGKTTLIKQMLKTTYSGYKTAIIENEFGSVNLDAEEFKKASVTVREITSGCICCTVKGSFIKVVDILSETNPDYIIIEPSGVANLTDVLDECAKSKKIVLNRIIMVVNAGKICKFMSVVGSFFKEQLLSANTVYLNFNENMTTCELDEAKKTLLAVNRSLRLVDIPLSLIDKSSFPEENSVSHPDSPHKNLTTTNFVLNSPNHSKTSIVMRPPKRDVLESLEYVFPMTFTEADILLLTELFQQEKCANVWRVKGCLRMKTGDIRKIDWVFGDNYQENLSDFAKEKTNILIIIGKNLPKQWLNSQLEIISSHK